MNKKQVLKRIISTVLSAALILTCIPFAAAKSTQTAKAGDLVLATVSDVHYYSDAIAKYKGEAFYTYLQGANCVYDDMNAIIDSAFASLKKSAQEQGLKYVVLSGDLTTNGEYEGHVALAEKLRAFEADTGIQVFVTAGNHDINNSAASQFVNPNGKKEPARKTTPQEFYEIYKEFGFSDSEAQFADFTAGTAGALSYAQVLDGGYRLIAVDAGKYSSDSTESGEDDNETGGKISEALLQWVLEQAQIAKQNGETPILVTHWNMSGMNYMHEYILQGFVIDDGYMLQETLADAGIHYAFSGHQHVSDLDITYSDSGEPMYSIITPVLTQFPFAYRETRFSRDNTGKITAKFDMIDVDAVKNVSSGADESYTAPYRQTTGFKTQFGNNGAEYLMRMVKNMLSGYINKIQSLGSVVAFIKEEFNFDIQAYLSGIIGDGMVFGGEEIFTVKNLMNFVNDLDRQIMKAFFADTDKLYGIIEDALTGLINVEVSDVPCTKFINTYGFGSTEHGGTIGDLLFSIIMYMYIGNEDISDDLFMQSVLQKAGTTDFVDLIFDSAIKYVVNDVVIDELLGTLQVNLGTLISVNNPNIAEYCKVLYIIIASLVGSEIFTAKNFQDFANKLYKFSNLLTDASHTVSYKYLAQLVLGTGYIKYGKTINEVINTLLDTYLGQTEREAAAYQLSVVCRDLLIDEDRDWDVTYTYNGAQKVTPTVDEMQLPANVNISFGTDPQSSVTVKWITKYSVTGTDIELVKKGGTFTGVPTISSQVKASSKQGEYNSLGFDFGTFGIMPWSHSIVEHTVTLTGLKADTEYEFRIGDDAKGFWSKTGSFTTAGSGSFTFLAAGNTAGVTPAQYDEWQNTLSAAIKAVPDARFIIHTGDSVYNGVNDNQWTWSLNSANSELLNMPLMYTAGDKDISETNCMTKYFGAPLSSQYIANTTGSYYSFDYNEAHICVLNTNELEDDGTLTVNQLKWLREDIAASEKMWKIVSLHQGLYGTSADNIALRNQLIKLIQDYDIDLIIQGNELCYTRSYMVNDNLPRPGCEVSVRVVNGKRVLSYTNYDGTVTVSPATAVAAAKSELPASEFNEAEETYGNVFITVTVDGGDLAVHSYTVSPSGKAQVIDSFGIAKSLNKTLAGDVDRDGVVTASDARLALRYSVGLEPNLRALAKLSADVDNDKRITASDARLILRVSVSLEKFSSEYISYFPDELTEIKY